MTHSFPSGEARRQLEYERWFAQRGIGNALLRWAIGPVGQWAFNTPLMKLRDHLQMRPQQRWLDIGCGRGSLLRFIDSRLLLDTSPVGIDFSPTAVHIARRNGQRGVRMPSFATAAATALPFADRTFDIVTCGYVIRHLTDSELASLFLEIRRVLAGGGLALIWEFAPSGNDTLDQWNRWWLSARVQESQLRSTRALLDAARAAGYELARYAGLRPFLFPPIPRTSIFIGKAPEGWVPVAAMTDAALPVTV